MLTWETHAGDLAFFWASVREQSPATAASPLSMKGNDLPSMKPISPRRPLRKTQKASRAFSKP